MGRSRRRYQEEIGSAVLHRDIVGLFGEAFPKSLVLVDRIDWNAVETARRTPRALPPRRRRLQQEVARLRAVHESFAPVDKAVATAHAFHARCLGRVRTSVESKRWVDLASLFVFVKELCKGTGRAPPAGQ